MRWSRYHHQIKRTSIPEPFNWRFERRQVFYLYIYKVCNHLPVQTHNLLTYIPTGAIPSKDVYYVVLEFHFDEHEVHNDFMNVFDTSLQSAVVAWNISNVTTNMAPTHTPVVRTTSKGGSFTGSFHPSRSQIAIQQAILTYRQQSGSGNGNSQTRRPTKSPTRAPTQSPSYTASTTTVTSVSDLSLFPILTLFDTETPLKTSLFFVSIYPFVSVIAVEVYALSSVVNIYTMTFDRV